MDVLEPEDLLFDSLQMLYDYHPITLTTAGKPFTHVVDGQGGAISISLKTPDTSARNWDLHASSIWVSSIYLADHIGRLQLDTSIDAQPPFRILELGASAGLPSILIAKLFPSISVIASDYPDQALISALSDNVQANNVADNCRAVPFAWGTDPAQFIPGVGDGFDMVIAADTLWNIDFHAIFIDALKRTLRRTSSARVHLVAGLHTGRYTIQGFLKRAVASGLELISIDENEANGGPSREWSAEKSGEDEKERRRWIIWIQLKWADL